MSTKKRRNRGSNSNRDCAGLKQADIDNIVRAIHTKTVFEVATETPHQRIDKLYRGDELQDVLVADLTKDADDPLKPYLQALALDNYGIQQQQGTTTQNITHENITLENFQQINDNLDRLYSIIFPNPPDPAPDEKTKRKLLKDWFNLYSCGKKRDILTKLSELVRLDEMIDELSPQNITVTAEGTENKITQATNYIAWINEIRFYVKQIKMTNFEYVGFNCGTVVPVRFLQILPVNPANLENISITMRNMYEIERILLASWQTEVPEPNTTLTFLIDAYLKCINMIFTGGAGDAALLSNLLKKKTNSLTSLFDDDGFIKEQDLRPPNINALQTRINELLMPHKYTVGPMQQGQMETNK